VGLMGGGSRTHQGRLTTANLHARHSTTALAVLATA
jgi:hypothetical protein